MRIVGSTSGLSLSVCALLLAAANQAGAQAAGSPPPTAYPRGVPTYRVDPAIDLPLLAIGATVSFGWTLWSEMAPAHCAPRCDRDTVLSIDRFSAGWYRPGWHTAGHVGVASIFALAGAALLIDEGPEAAVVDAVVVAQAVLGALTLSTLTNTAVGRPRPFLYGDAAPAHVRTGYASLSFFSGHTANAFAATLATYQTLQRRNPGRLVNHIVLAVGLIGASFVGASRIVSGHHFLSDVAAGAVVGSAMGVMVPALHDSPVAVHAHGQGIALTAVLP